MILFANPLSLLNVSEWHTQMTAPSSSGLSTCMILILTGNWLVILNPNLKVQENGTNEPSLGRCVSLALSVVVYAESLISCLCLGKGEWGREKTEDIPNVGIKIFTFFTTYLYSLRLEHIAEHNFFNLYSLLRKKLICDIVAYIFSYILYIYLYFLQI